MHTHTSFHTHINLQTYIHYCVSNLKSMKDYFLVGFCSHVIAKISQTELPETLCSRSEILFAIYLLRDTVYE